MRRLRSLSKVIPYSCRYDILHQGFDQSCQHSHAFAVWHTILPVFTRTDATHPITHAKKQTKQKHDLGPRLVRSFSNSPMVLDGADGVYGWLHPEVSNRRRDTPKDNERNDHLEKSDDESELRLGM